MLSLLGFCVLALPLGILGTGVASGLLDSSVPSKRAGDFCWSVGWDMEMLRCCWGSWAGSEEALDACRWGLPGALVLVWPPLVEQQASARVVSQDIEPH